MALRLALFDVENNNSHLCSTNQITQISPRKGCIWILHVWRFYNLRTISAAPRWTVVCYQLSLVACCTICDTTQCIFLWLYKLLPIVQSMWHLFTLIIFCREYSWNIVHTCPTTQRSINHYKHSTYQAIHDNNSMH